MEKIDSFAAEAEQFDDITMLSFQVTWVKGDKPMEITGSKSAENRRRHFRPDVHRIICAGLCGGFASLLACDAEPCGKQPVGLYPSDPDADQHRDDDLSDGVGRGYRATERFGGTPILGGMLGTITSLEGINRISAILGLITRPFRSILCSAKKKGGVLAVIVRRF